MMFRSALYIPADHDRAMAKSASLQADALIFDLEDGVSAAHKAKARAALEPISAIRQHPQHCVVRINHHSTAYYGDDLALIARLPIDGVMLSKVSHADDVVAAHERLSTFGRGDLPIWCNVETPVGFMNIHSIVSHPTVAALVAGTNDLANDLRIVRTPDRAGLMHCLQSLVLAARAYGKVALDGTFIDLEDAEGLKREAEQGRMLGFDGKTLIHPKQIESVNIAFSASDSEKSQAARIIAAYEAAMKEGKAVTLLDGVMLEELHYKRAQALLNANA